MKIPFLIVTTLVVVLASNAYSQVTFGDTKWRQSPEETKAALEKLDFKHVERTSKGDHFFEGNFLGREAGIIARFNPQNQLLKIKLLIEPPKNRVILHYKGLLSRLKDNHGKPDEEFEVYARPYFKGDGFEEQAIRLNKGQVFAVWTKKLISIEITNTLLIVISYEHPSWGTEVERRQQDEKNAL